MLRAARQETHCRKRLPRSTLCFVYEDDNTADFTRMWAEAVVRQVQAVRSIRVAADLQLREAERGEDWSPTDEDLQRTWREHWVTEHTLIWAAYQLQCWAVRLGNELRSESGRRLMASKIDVPDDPILRDLRNVLEHLDEANLVDYFAAADGTPGTSNRSLRRMPGEMLELVLGHHHAFQLIDPDDLERRALVVLEALDAESDAHTEYLGEEYLANHSGDPTA